MAHFQTFANDLLDREYDTAGTGTFPLGAGGATAYTFPVKLCLTTNALTATTTPTEPSGGSYAPANLPTMSAAAAASKASSGSVTYSNCPAFTWNDVYTKDSSGTPKPMNFRGGPGLARTVNLGDSVLVTSLTGQE